MIFCGTASCKRHLFKPAIQKFGRWIRVDTYTLLNDEYIGYLQFQRQSVRLRNTVKYHKQRLHLFYMKFQLEWRGPRELVPKPSGLIGDRSEKSIGCLSFGQSSEKLRINTQV